METIEGTMEQSQALLKEDSTGHLLWPLPTCCSTVEGWMGQSDLDANSFFYGHCSNIDAETALRRAGLECYVP